MKHRDFPSLVESERHRFVSYVRSLVTESAELDAEDAVHDVLVRILERADSVPLDNLAAYVYRSLRNRVIDHLRTRKVTLSLDAESEGGGRLVDLLQDVGPSAIEMLQSEEGRQELFEALAKLSDMEREVVVAHELEGIAFKDLSLRWRVPQNTLLSHKSRAMKKLKMHFLDTKGGM